MLDHDVIKDVNAIVDYFNVGINFKNPISEKLEGIEFLMSIFDNKKRFSITGYGYEIYTTPYVVISVIEKLENYFRYKGIKATIKLEGNNLEIEGFL